MSDLSEEDFEEEEEEDDEEGEEVMVDDFYGSDMDYIDFDFGNDVLEMFDDVLYDEDGEEFDYDDGGGFDDDDDDDEEEGDFEEFSLLQLLYMLLFGVCVLFCVIYLGSYVECIFNFGLRDYIFVLRVQVEVWFVIDYFSVMLGVDSRVEVQIVGELQIVGG